MPKLDVTDVAAIACELLHMAPADLVDVLDVEGVAEILSSTAAGAAVPHEAAAGLLHGFLAHPPIPHLERRLALLVAAHFLARSGLDIDLEPGEETRKHLQAIAIGAATLEETISWLDPRVTAQGKEGEMFERFTAGARRVLALADEESRRLGHGFVGTGHLLLGLLQEPEGTAAAALAASGLSLEAARAAVAAAPRSPGAAPTGERPFSTRAKKVLELSLRESLQRGSPVISPADLLLGLLREGGGGAMQVLRALGPDPVRLREAVTELAREYAPLADEAQAHRRASDPPEDVEIVEAYLAGRPRQSPLTRVDEVRLAQLVESGRAARKALEEASDDPELDREQLKEQVDEGEEARRTLVESNLHVCVSIASRYRESAVPLPELVEAGQEGLQRAIERFDWRKGFPFATYATWWVKHAITRRAGGPIALMSLTDARPPVAPASGRMRTAEEVGRMLERLDPHDRQVIRMRFRPDGSELRTVDEVAVHFEMTREQVHEVEARLIELLRRPDADPA